MQATATFGGGCFWCTEAVFQQLRGVSDVSSGYAGGEVDAPSYEAVCRGSTGHAEVVQLQFDDELISYADLLRIHLTTHDPTTLNRQGADQGTQYRSIILYHDEAQLATAREVLAEMAMHFSEPIVTELAAFRQFYRAEEHHQNYYRDNPYGGYCMAVIAPKLAKFRQLFSDYLQR